MTTNPIIWILVAMVACLHATYLIARKLNGPTHWVRLWVIVVLPCVICFNGLTGFSDLSGIFLVATLCGAFLAVRAQTTMSAVLVFAGFLFAGIIGSCVVRGWSDGDTYAGADPDWETRFSRSHPNDYFGGRPPFTVQTPLQAMSNVWAVIQADKESAGNKRHDSKIKPGFLDEQDEIKFNKGPFVFIEPIPQWYSWFTGLYLPRRHIFRISTPGGAADFAANRAELVETDGHGARAGTPIPINATDAEGNNGGGWVNPFKEFYLPDP